MEEESVIAQQHAVVTARLETAEAVAIERAQLSGRWPSMAEQDIERRAGTRKGSGGGGRRRGGGGDDGGGEAGEGTDHGRRWSAVLASRVLMVKDDGDCIDRATCTSSRLCTRLLGSWQELFMRSVIPRYSSNELNNI